MTTHRQNNRSGSQGLEASKSAFTLIELLVVIALIAVLSSLLFTALSRGKQAASGSVCWSNLRQLGLAAQMYWDDHEGRTFRYRGVSTNGGDNYWFGWIERGPEGTRRFDAAQGVLARYGTARGIETCPSLNISLREFKRKAEGASYGYGYNLTLSSSVYSSTRKIQEFLNPSGLTVFADSAQINTFQQPASPDNPMLEEFYYINQIEATTHFRHRNTASSFFLDGHVGREKMKIGTLDIRLPTHQVGRLADARITGG